MENFLLQADASIRLRDGTIVTADVFAGSVCGEQKTFAALSDGINISVRPSNSIGIDWVCTGEPE